MIGFRMEQEQLLKQTQKLSAVQQQSLQLLQLALHDLIPFLLEQAEMNPMLEVEFPKTGPREKKTALHGSDSDDPLLRVRAEEQTLEKEIVGQLCMIAMPADLFQIAQFLAGNLNEDGYLMISLDEASKLLGCSIKRVEEGLAVLQQVDPPGIGARTLEECLALQIRANGNAPAGALEIVTQCLADLAASRYEKIAAKLGLAIREVRRAADYIRSLNPRPGLKFGVAQQVYIVPDVIVNRMGNGYTIHTNDKYLPKVSISKSYSGLLHDSNSHELRAYLQDAMQSAQWVIRGLKQRQRTLLRIADAIITEQLSFLEMGVKGIRPLSITDLAVKVGFHPSTVSRAVQGKYMRTPNGLMEFRKFFSTGISTADGNTASVRILQNRISEMIRNEDRKKPLSDQSISDLLRNEGYIISRRTVAKYREQMGILSSALRRR